jgi:biotin synthase
MNKTIENIAEGILADGQAHREQMDTLIEEGKKDFFDLLYYANRIRGKFFANRIKLCSIVPGKLGGCDQDCKFCAQSTRYKTHIGRARVLSDEEISMAAEQASRNGVPNFGIVYSGKAITEKELARLENLIKAIKKRFGLQICVSLGIINHDQARRLTKAGVSRYNHNLETSQRYFPSIVSTHKYADRLRTIKLAKEAGLGVCAGGIFGIGETDQDRIDMALELRGLGVDTVPMNFLHPIAGTPLGNTKALEPKEVLSIIAIYRFILPRTHLKIAGGRALNLRDLQSWMFYAGASSLLSGNCLTTTQRPVEEDIQMLTDLGLQCEGG